MDKTAVQHSLDLAADELERLGYMDLATHVDGYAHKLMAAEGKDIPSIYRALRNICVEAERRGRNQFDKPLMNSAAVKARVDMIRRKMRARKLAELKQKAEEAKEEKKDPAPAAPAAPTAPAPQAEAVKARLERIRRLTSRKS